MSTESQLENLIELVGKVDYMYKQINTLSTKFDFLIGRFHEYECRLENIESQLCFILKCTIALVSYTFVKVVFDFVKVFL